MLDSYEISISLRMNTPNAAKKIQAYIINFLSKQSVVDHFFLLRKTFWE
jgi:hypothetical protein